MLLHEVARYYGLKCGSFMFRSFVSRRRLQLQKRAGYR